MTTFYVLNVPENASVAMAAADDPTVTVDGVGPYFEISADDSILVDRRATGCRHAVWFSCVAGLRHARIAQHDKDALKVVAS